MVDFADIASAAIDRQRFAAVGVAVLVLAVASFSNTERSLFEGGMAPSAFSAVPKPISGEPGRPIVALPSLRSFVFHRPDGPDATTGSSPSLPGAATGLAPVEIASLTPGLAPEVAQANSGLLNFSGAPMSDGSGPAAGFVTPSSTGQPTTTLPAPGPGGTGTTTNPGTGTTTNPGTGTTTNPGTGTTTNPGTGTTTNPGTGTTTNPGTGTTTNPGTGTTTNPGAPTVSAVPEPATWAMMMLGFFSIGITTRGRRARLKRLAA